MRLLKSNVLVHLLIFYLSLSLNAQNNSKFSPQVKMGHIENPNITEASGIVESIQNQHVFWVHNDRNNQNRIFSFNTTGKNLGEFYLYGVENRDWEDIAIGPGPEEGIEYLYIGEFGDNNSEHEFKYIYRIKEPIVHFNQNPVIETIYIGEWRRIRYNRRARNLHY